MPVVLMHRPLPGLYGASIPGKKVGDSKPAHVAWFMLPGLLPPEASADMMHIDLSIYPSIFVYIYI